ncbi:MAG TPA: MaoC/PaaZ C-terminal domain-containing protein [Solirubrobacterales bacterium]
MARSLLPSYAKAIVGPLIPGGGDGLPDHHVEETEVEIDPDHLAAYDRVCGFGIRDTLPPTYPHILGFPLQMSLMTERAFPFALLGMVHIGNRIEQRAAIPLTARPTVRVRAENLRPHQRGQQLDMVTEVELDGELVWLEHSNYLKRGSGADESAPPNPLAERIEPGTLEPAAVWKVPGDVGRRYADVSGDRNPIHLHPLTARLFGFPSAIAHGMWTLARCLAAFEGRYPASHTSEVAFQAPLRIPGKARLADRRRDGAWDFSLERPDGERAHVVGTIDTA